MATVSERFEEVQTIYQAIKDIAMIQEQTINDPKDSKLDQTMMAIKEISRDCFDKNLETKIISEIKEMITKAYEEKFKSINEDLNKPVNNKGLIDDLANSELDIRSHMREVV